MNTALQRAVELLAEPPSNPDVSKGYLDLLGEHPGRRSRSAEEHRTHPGGMGLAHRVDALRQGADHGAQVDDRLSAPDGVARHPAGRHRTRCRQRARQRHSFAGACRGAGRAGPRRRHLRADAGPRGACRGGSASRFPARGRAATSVPRPDVRCGGLDRHAAVDTGTVGGAGRDGQGAATRRARWP